jgi:hypothetical protein
MRVQVVRRRGLSNSSSAAVSACPSRANGARYAALWSARACRAAFFMGHDPPKHAVIPVAAAHQGRARASLARAENVSPRGKKIC